MSEWPRGTRSEGISRRAKVSAEHRRCPACGRGNALKRHLDTTGYLGSVTTCRWCSYERVHPPLFGG